MQLCVTFKITQCDLCEREHGYEIEFYDGIEKEEDIVAAVVNLIEKILTDYELKGCDHFHAKFTMHTNNSNEMRSEALTLTRTGFDYPDDPNTDQVMVSYQYTHRRFLEKAILRRMMGHGNEYLLQERSHFSWYGVPIRWPTVVKALFSFTTENKPGAHTKSARKGRGEEKEETEEGEVEILKS